MSYAIAEIEDAILAALAASAMSAYCRVFETWGGGVEGLIARRTLLVPACYVAYGGAYYADLTGGGQDKRATFGVIVFARNPRGERAARRGGPGATEVGAYEMLEDARAALHNSDLGLNILSCRAAREEALDIGANYAAYSLYLEVEWRFEG